MIDRGSGVHLILYGTMFAVNQNTATQIPISSRQPVSCLIDLLYFLSEALTYQLRPNTEWQANLVICFSIAGRGNSGTPSTIQLALIDWIGSIFKDYCPQLRFFLFENQVKRNTFFRL